MGWPRSLTKWSDCGLRWSFATPNSVILPHSTPDSGSFIIISSSGLDQLGLSENGKNTLRIFLEDVNTLSHQCNGGERCYPSNALWGDLEVYQGLCPGTFYFVWKWKKTWRASMHYLINGERQFWGGMKMGKMFEIFWRVSTNYLISAGLENGDMLPNYPPWCGLSKGSDCDLYLVKMGKI